MRYRSFARGEAQVSVLAFGAWQLAHAEYWGPAEHGAEAVRAALDAGITLFDTAEGYGAGASETALGKALGADRERVLVATKLSQGRCAPAQVAPACEESLRRLGMDRIDLYQVHWPNWGVPFADTFAELAKLRDQGKIRWIGLSNFGRRDLDEWMTVGDAVSDQLGYNLLFRAVEPEIVPACVRHGLGVLVYMPLLQGILAGKWGSVDEIPPARRRTRHFAGSREGVRHGGPGYEELTLTTLRELRALAAEVAQPLATIALAWLLHREAVAAVIVGGREPAQVTRNLAAVDLRLSKEALARIDRITAPLKAAFGANADMWDNDANSRIR